MIKRKLAFCLISLICLIISIATPISASSGKSYVLDGLQRMPVPDMYEVSKVNQSFTDPRGEVLQLNNPQDLFINDQGLLYIVDSGNNRIIKAELDGKIIAVYTKAGDGTFNNPQGIFVDKKGNMYIADTDNFRIVHLDYEGNYVEEFKTPKGLIGQDTTFNPAKIAISSTGNIYVVKGQGVLTIDSQNRFRGYIGQTQIGFDLTEALVRMFASEEQKSTITKRLAASYTNIMIDDNDNLYCTTLDNKIGEIKRLNSVGNNTFRKTGGVSSLKLDFSAMFLSNSYIASSGTAFYGDRKNDLGKSVKSDFADLAVNESGIVYALDKATCRVYIYDSEGNLLGTFGSKGIQKGKFVLPSSIAIDGNGNLYVLDSGLNNLQVFKPTNFEKTVQKAIDYYYSGNYTEAHNYWLRVLSIDENYTMAQRGLGKTFYKTGENTQAMSYFKKANDISGYSDAFSKNFYNKLRDNFALYIFIGFVFICTFIFLILTLFKLSKQIIRYHDTRSEKRFGVLRTLQLTASSVFHPCDTFENIKYMRGNIKWLPILILPLSAVIVRIAYINFVHYPLADINARQASYFLEAVKLLVPYITFVIAAYAVSAIMSGEVKFKELCLAGALCFSPYIFATLPIGLLSQILSASNSNIYSSLKNIITIWTLVLFFNSVRVTNRYSVKKTAVVTIISFLVMILMWVIVFLIVALWNQVYLFIIDILTEIGFISR